MTPEADGLVAWRPAFERIRVQPTPDGGRWLIVTEDGRAVYSRQLSPAQAAHLAGLLRL